MKDILTKILSDISAGDIARLIENQQEEGSTLELKGPLPVPKKHKDPWENGERRILDSTRDEILAEVVAMANGAGGVVLLGIDETDTNPKRADASHPLPNCVELAERLSDMAWSCIDPRLPTLEVKGIPLGGDDAGVVLIRVPQSLRGPHGLTTTRRAYIRRGSRTETMFVREIQERTLQTQRGLNRIEERLSERSKAFNGWWPYELSEVGGAIRVTVIPTSQIIGVDVPYLRKELWPLPENRVGSVTLHGNEFRVRFHATAQLYEQGMGTTSLTEPILRGGRRQMSTGGDVFLRQEIHCDGLSDFWCRFTQGGLDQKFDPEIVVAAAIEALRLGDLARRAGGAPGAELLMEVELASNHAIMLLPLRMSGTVPVDQISDRTFKQQHLLLPRITVIGDDYSSALKILLDDLLNAAGNANVEKLSVDLW